MRVKAKYTYFYCLGRHTKRTECDEPYTPAKELETKIEDLYRDVQLDGDSALAIKGDLEEELDVREANRARSAEHLTRTLNRLDSERDKLLKAYYADAITLDQLKAEQGRIDTEMSRTQHQLALTRDHLQAARRLIDVAIRFATSLHDSYVGATSQTRQSRNQAVLSAVYVASRDVTDHKYEWPFGFMPKGHFGSSSKNRQVELRGFEPLTP